LNNAFFIRGFTLRRKGATLADEKLHTPKQMYVYYHEKINGSVIGMIGYRSGSTDATYNYGINEAAWKLAKSYNFSSADDWPSDNIFSFVSGVDMDGSFTNTFTLQGIAVVVTEMINDAIPSFSEFKYMGIPTGEYRNNTASTSGQGYYYDLTD